MDAAKMTRAQLAKFVAEGRKQKFDRKSYDALRRSRQQLTQSGKGLAALAKQNPQV